MPALQAAISGLTRCRQAFGPLMSLPMTPVLRWMMPPAQPGGRLRLHVGNHDEFARKYLGHNFGGVEVVDEHIHTLADGRTLWVTHGDYFDAVIQCAKWLAYVGDWAYELTLRFNRHFNSLRARLGLPYWSLSKYLKQKVKRAVSYVGDFESAVAREARARGVAWRARCRLRPHPPCRDASD